MISSGYSCSTLNEHPIIVTIVTIVAAVEFVVVAFIRNANFSL